MGLDRLPEFDPVAAAIAAGVALVAIPVLVAVLRARHRTAVIRYPSTDPVMRVPRTLRSRLRWLVPALRVLAVLLLLVAFARPRKGDEITEVATQGIAVQMVVDRSSSMWENAMEFEGQMLPRLEVVKRVFKQFVLGAGELEGRPNDMIGLTTFARFAEEECPLTLDHGNLVGFIDSLTHAQSQVENGTNISDALYQAVLSLVVAEDYVRETHGRDDEYHITSKVIILLTDGEQQRGINQHSFREAATYAKENDIKIHTIAITGGRDRQRGSIFSLLTDRIDTRNIEFVAEETSGLFRMATDGDALREIYEQIDALERTEFRQTFRRYHELFAWPVLLAFACLAVEVLLATTWLRRAP